MKRLIGADIGQYSFNPATRTVALSLVPAFQLAQILVITNVTSGVMLYNFADASMGGMVVGNEIILDLDTTAMHAEDELQIWVDLPVAPERADEQESLHPAFTLDTNLASVFGGQPLTDAGALRASVAPRRAAVINGTLMRVGSEIRIPCLGANTVAIQLSGTWAGTHTFQVSVNGADFLPCHAVPAGGGTVVSTTAGNGIWVINCAGFAFVRVFWSTYTSGISQVCLSADAGHPMNVSFPASQITADSMLGTTYAPAHSDTPQQVVAPVVAWPQPSSYAAAAFSQYPQRYRRLRTQTAGDQMLPFAQETGTNRQLVATPELRSLLEELLLQHTLTNQLLAQAFNLPLPGGAYEPR